MRECSDFIDLHMALQLSKHHFLKRLCVSVFLPHLLKINWPWVVGLFSALSVFCYGGAFFCPVACRILIPQSGIEPLPSAVEMQSPNHWTTRESLGLSFLFCWSRCLFLCQCHAVLITIALNYCLKSGRVELPALFFSLGIALAILGFLWFHINFRIFLVLWKMSWVIWHRPH